jgi:hypothetical protein
MEAPGSSETSVPEYTASPPRKQFSLYIRGPHRLLHESLPAWSRKLTCLLWLVWNELSVGIFLLTTFFISTVGAHIAPYWAEAPGVWYAVY